MATENPIVRHATRDDVALVLTLIRELAEYEKHLSSVEATEQSLLDTLSFADGIDPIKFSHGYCKALLVEDPSTKQAAGIALYFYNYSTWAGKPGIYLEDLYVRPEYQRRGYAAALVKGLAREVKEMGGKRLDWNCLRWNEMGLGFSTSEAVGAVMNEEYVGLWARDERLHRLAA